MPVVNPRKCRRHGLTLVEVLIVLGILVLLIAILLPGIQMARESARGSTCKNNLKQIGLALHNYHETYGFFPMPYMIDAGTPSFSPPYNLNAHAWGTMILPFLDSSPVYSRMKLDTPCYSAQGIATVNSIIGRWGRPPHNVAKATGNEVEISSKYACFNCPNTPGGPRVSRRGYVELEQRFNVYDPLAPGTMLSVSSASSDYQVLNGLSAEFATRYFQKEPQPDLKGILSDANVCTRIREVTDGLSNTWMVGERAAADEVWRDDKRVHSVRDGVFVELQSDGKHFNRQSGGSWGDFGSGDFLLSGALEDGTSPVGHGPCLINCTNLNHRGLYGFHPNGIHVLRGDGAVQFVDDTIDTDIVAEALTRQGWNGPQGPP